MMEWLLVILIFLGVIAVTAVLFGGWVIVIIATFIWRMLGGFSRGFRRRRIAGGSNGGLACANSLCRAANPPGARFCRRCGSAIPPAERVIVRRAAMW